jgi:hypothetical protein
MRRRNPALLRGFLFPSLGTPHRYSTKLVPNPPSLGLSARKPYIAPTHDTNSLISPYFNQPLSLQYITNTPTPKPHYKPFKTLSHPKTYIHPTQLPITPHAPQNAGFHPYSLFFAHTPIPSLASLRSGTPTPHP